MNAPEAAARARAAAMFRRYWFATSVSGAGSAVTVIALPLVAVFKLGASVAQVALLAAGGQIGWLLLGLPAGVIVQRFPLRRLQVAMDLARLAAIGSVPLVWWLGRLSYPYLLAAAVVVSLSTVLFDIGSATFLPAIVDKEELNARNSLMSGTLAVTQTGGPSLGGALVQLLGPVAALLADALSYLVSALTLGSLPEAPRAEVPAGPRPGLFAQIREGWTFVVRHPVMLPCMLWATATNFVCGALTGLTPVYLVRQAHVPAGLIGVLVAAEGVGALLGSMAAPRLAARVGTARALLLAGFGGGLLALLAPLTTGLGDAWCFALGNAGFAAGVVVGSIVTRTHRQTQTPRELLSRVMATVRFVSWGAAPIGAALSGVLATAVGLRPAFWAVCAAALAGPLILAAGPVRARRDLADPEPAGQPAQRTAAVEQSKAVPAEQPLAA
ncbi:MFS family permease [Streptacidiphilus sp. MAP12-33]|uniref:MFS transporter n=1 Tax=Streptacidiphilus sp. MAP12-33 TaxID=3156266 RepID=UPI0035144882